MTELWGPKFDWNAGAIATLKQGWADGLSASEIATELGGDVSRCAVLGKVSRLHLEPRRVVIPASDWQKQTPKRNHRPKPRKSHHGNIGNITGGLEHRLQGEKLDPVPVSLDDQAIPLDQRRTFADLEPCHCKWIVGEPREEHFYCGAPRVEAEPYCQPHLRRAFQPGTARRAHVAEGMR